jgi:uncharacterized RDD family membrane protein YckC
MSNIFKTQNIEWQARLQGVQLATFPSRAAAFMVDALVIALILLLPSIWDSFTSTTDKSIRLSITFEGLASTAIAIGYFALSTYLGNGSSLGKRILGIRVISIIHSRMSFWHCLERALGYAASFLEAGFGFVQYFTHPNHQTVHDRIAETIVINRKQLRAEA